MILRYAFGFYQPSRLFMHTSRIAIIGAGLAGLYAAYLLEQRGISDYV
ncbi:NAD(P)-binding protein, partial [Pantoea sp. SIMBA_133]